MSVKATQDESGNDGAGSDGEDDGSLYDDILAPSGSVSMSGGVLVPSVQSLIASGTLRAGGSRPASDIHTPADAKPNATAIKWKPVSLPAAKERRAQLPALAAPSSSRRNTDQGRSRDGSATEQGVVAASLKVRKDALVKAIQARLVLYHAVVQAQGGSRSLTLL